MGRGIFVIIGVFLLLHVFLGYRKGLLKSLLQLSAWILSFAIASAGAEYIGEIIRPIISDSTQNIFAEQIAFVTSFLGITIALRIIFAVLIHIFNKVNDLPGIGFLNRIAGAILGLAKGSIVVLAVLFLISWMPRIGMDNAYHKITGQDEQVEKIIEDNPLWSQN